jgi:RHS repeat-associated protein
VDGNGNLVSTRKYDVYGGVRGSTGPSGSKHKFVGALGHTSEDETGLVYMRARHYDPAIGRFASEDPAHDGNNWFAYGRNNPVSFVDSTGNSPELVIEAINEAMGIYTKYLHGELSAKEARMLLRQGIQALKGFANLFAIEGQAEIELGAIETETDALLGGAGTILGRIGTIQQGLGARTLSASAGAQLAAGQLELLLLMLM